MRRVRRSWGPLPGLAGAAIFLTAGALQAATEAHGKEGIPRSLLFSGINFLILAGILVYFLRKPVRDFFASRATLIRTTMSQAQELKSNAARKYEEYEGRMKRIEQEMQALIEELKNDGELERRRLVESAKKQAAGLRETSQRVISQELRRAKEELKQEAIALAADLAEKLVRDNFSPQDQSRIIDQYLQRLERME